MRLEVVTLPVSDVERAKSFYAGLGWRLDADFHFENGGRGIQFTPPGSACSIHFGTGLVSTPPGSVQGLEMVVEDIAAAREELRGRGVQVGEISHREGNELLPGLDPQRRSYFSLASFQDPDGNGWALQEVTERAPGRTTSPTAIYGSVGNLAEALRRAAEAYREHEKEGGQSTDDWAQWYAQYMTDEAA